jgi:hypothetical protein
VFDEEGAPAVAMRLADDRPPIDIARDPICPDQSGRLDRFIVLIGDHDRGTDNDPTRSSKI